ncbi:aldo/keto reductase [Gracilibacillus salinarum]|uniref:Aldo/keto reductase n=1 Tax=Gracilibacillus salinarum TaxID=2932255 RepID=A0ABY4GPZ2_9BACI|nr:aldo/keto reductase [Gracilibacillus salinarum]UOQ86468.1 aldo/keto reductase [Gracilibacillus salinarum]
MKYRKLGSTDLDVSVLSFGASSLGSVFRKVNEQEGINTVHRAFDGGINYFDVSPYYGLTKAETLLGKAMKGMPRDQFILSTKAGRYGENEFDFSKQRIIQSAEESLTRLQTDYIDMMFLHDIEFGSYAEIIEQGIPALQQLREEGKIGYFGVSGLPLSVFEKMVEGADLDVILSYCHYSLNDSSLLHLVPLCEQKKVGIINASPISMGLLNTRPVADWHPASEEIISVCKQAASFCAKQGEDLAKLAIQFAVQNEKIATTLVSTASEDNIANNMRWMEEPVDQDLLESVLDILQPIHNKTWTSGRKEWR